MKTIYNVYVPIESQEQADRMKKICIDYGLPYINAFNIELKENWFEYDENIEMFLVTVSNVVGQTEFGKTQVTESEFLELVKMLNK